MVISTLIVIAYGLFFMCAIRGVCNAIIRYLMNKNAYRKRKKGMTFKEWFTYSRFRVEVPKYHIVFMYLSIVLYAIILIGVILVHLSGVISDLDINRLRGYLGIFTIIISFIYSSIFCGIHTAWTRVNRPDKIKYRGINKKEYMERRRQENRKKKKEELEAND